jgi:hypothetical protein
MTLSSIEDRDLEESVPGAVEEKEITQIEEAKVKIEPVRKTEFYIP